MFYEGEVTFLKRKPFIFVNDEDITEIEKNKPYELLVAVEETKINLLRNQHHRLGQLLIENYQIRQDADGQLVQQARTFVIYRPKDKRKDHTVDLEIMKIKTSSKGLQQIFKERASRKVRLHSSPLSYYPSKQPKTSLLSTESHEQKFRGLLNLAAIILVVLNIRNIIDNFFKYGNQLARGSLTLLNGNGIPALLMFVIYILLQYQIELMLFQKKITRRTSRILTHINVWTALFFHIYLCHTLNMLPIPALMITAYLMIMVLKFMSYYQVNAEIYYIVERMQLFEKNQNYRDLLAPHEIDNANLEIIATHKNDLVKLLDFKHYLYFLAAPTLCYQLEYPRNAKVRWLWLFKRCLEFSIIGALQLILWVQYYQPALDKMAKTVSSGNYTYLNLLAELLEMSVPTILMWLGGFYMFFQVWLNILAEILRFADRRFYDDWWNCKNLMQYWQLWNLPVHYWFIRHLYNPLLKKGVSKQVANLTVFLISAVAHEYLVSVPLGVKSYYAFLAMLLQSPMIWFELKMNKVLKLNESQLGNMSFWISYCILGQPICVSIYYYLYVTKPLN